MNEIATQWVEALRSGNYEQGQERLRDGDDKRCCLGVLADVIGLEWLKHHARNSDACELSVIDPDTNESYSDFLPDTVYASLDLSVSQDKYSVMNDEKGYTFDEIADYIEDHEDIS
jgi:hypothetical protein